MLRTLLLVGFNIFIGAFCLAQYFLPTQGNALWVGAWWVGPGYPHWGWSYSFDAASPDTLINGLAYKMWYGMPVRESGTGQVYFRNPGIDADLLWYDFDVEVGDTVRFGMTMGFPAVDSVQVVSVDTVMHAGVERKRIGVSYEFGQGNFPCAHWIQGIGSTIGPENMCAGPSVSGGQWLVCMSIDGVVQYGINEGQAVDCMIHMSVPSSDARLEVSVWPNPGGDELRVRLPAVNLHNALLRVRDARGALWEEWLIRSREVQLHTGTWPSGLYLLEIEQNGFVVLSTKWMRD